MTENTPEVKVRSVQERQREVAGELSEKARAARRAIGAMLLVPGALDPEERRELERAQMLVHRFVR